MTTLFPDLSVTLRQRRWACVLDPVLALSEYGLPLVKQLGDVMNLWVVREFWHMLEGAIKNSWSAQRAIANKDETLWRKSKSRFRPKIRPPVIGSQNP